MFVSSIEVSPDGSRLVAGGRDGSIRVLDLVSGQEIQRFQGHDDTVTDVAFAPDGTLASASRDTTIKLWSWTSAPSC